MKYITSLHALNLPCALNTPGDWHFSALNWDKPFYRESEESIFKDYGLEFDRIIPGYSGKYVVANHLRAYLDMLDLSHFSSASGFGLILFEDTGYIDELFSKVYSMQQLDNWDSIDDFMGREFYYRWLDYKDNELFPKNNEERGVIIYDFVRFVNDNSNNFILKNGVALSLCYGSNRVIDRIDFDTFTDLSLSHFISGYCKFNNFSYTKIDTSPGNEIYKIKYFSSNDQITVEMINRLSKRPLYGTKVINNILTYPLEDILNSKLQLYTKSFVFSDIFDIIYILKNFYDKLDSRVIYRAKNILYYNGLERIDYIIRINNTKIIDLNNFIHDSLFIFDKLKILPSNYDYITKHISDNLKITN